MGNYGNYGYCGEALPGLQFGFGAKDDMSYAAVEKIYPGRAVVCYPGEKGVCGHPHKDEATITYSTNFITGNSTIVTVNGESTAAVVFDTDQATTMAALIAAIAGLSTVSSAVISGTKAVVITTKYAAVTAASVTTLGDTQPTANITYGNADKIFLGVAMRVHRAPDASDDTAMYNVNDAVSVREFGNIIVKLDSSAPANNSAVAILTTPEASVGLFTRSTTSGAIALDGLYRDGFTSDSTLKIVKVEGRKAIS